jgi:hypothetical protein
MLALSTGTYLKTVSPQRYISRNRPLGLSKGAVSSVAFAQPQGKSLLQMNFQMASSGFSSLQKPILRKLAT